MKNVQKYCKKPVVVEAFKLSLKTLENVREFITSEYYVKRVWLDEFNNLVYHKTDRVGVVIHTLEGNHLAVDGDYIIKGVHGEFYPCKSDIFHETYEIVEN